MASGLLVRLADIAEDAWLERAFALPLVERVVFGALASRFDTRAADGFEGRIVYELERPATGGACSRWTVQIISGRAVLRPHDTGEATILLRMPVADFVRIAAGAIDPAEPVLKGRAHVSGDLGVAARIPEMFRAAGSPP
jgi:SCP-2 sterol transfer family protein